jgi:hypothetical protein
VCPAFGQRSMCAFSFWEAGGKEEASGSDDDGIAVLVASLTDRKGRAVSTSPRSEAAAMAPEQADYNLETRIISSGPKTSQACKGKYMEPTTNNKSSLGKYM